MKDPRERNLLSSYYFCWAKLDKYLSIQSDFSCFSTKHFNLYFSKVKRIIQIDRCVNMGDKVISLWKLLTTLLHSIPFNVMYDQVSLMRLKALIATIIIVIAQTIWQYWIIFITRTHRCRRCLTKIQSKHAADKIWAALLITVTTSIKFEVRASAAAVILMATRADGSHA